MAKQRTQNQQTTPEGRVKVTLLKSHLHGGIVFKAGDEIEVTQAQADWLEARGVINGQAPILEEV